MLLEKYSPNWVNEFNSIKAEIEKALSENKYVIEHVGSTAVPNLDAKPIIDIDIIFSNPADFKIIKTALENIGYYHNGDQGIKDRDVFKRIGKEQDQILDTIKHHLCLSKL